MYQKLGCHRDPERSRSICLADQLLDGDRLGSYPRISITKRLVKKKLPSAPSSRREH